MGLMDARRLAKSLTRLDELLDALKDYENNRKKQVRFYQMMSHYLTPFFQSDSKVLSTIRDLTFHPMSKLPFMSELMMQTLAGVKTGPFSSLKKI
jgi:salicylate hydroxylase